jgi:hypothetical protein
MVYTSNIKYLPNKEKMSKIGNFLKETARDLMILAGFAAFTYGIWIIFEPAAYIIGGAIIMWLAIPARKIVKKVK